MVISVTSKNLPASWKRSFEGSLVRSSPFGMAILYNGMCFIALAKTSRILFEVRKSDPGLLVFLAFVLFFFSFAAFSMLQVYRQAKAELLVQENSPLLVVSYIAYRLYLCVLGVTIMLSGIIGLLR